MTSSGHSPKLTLPTLDRLRASVPDNVSPANVASDWLNRLAEFLTSTSSPHPRDNSDSLSQLFLDDAVWKDILALTWDYRSVHGIDKIRALVDARSEPSGLSVSEIAADSFRAPVLRSPFPDLSWIQFGFDLKTNVGKGLGYARLVPTSDGKWKAYTLSTSLESLDGFEFQNVRNAAQEHAWREKREQKIKFSDRDPTVLIVGAGHSGLELAANLVQMDVDCLVIDKNRQIGDNWRNRYEALCTHDPIWYDQFPFMQFPSTWPVYSPKDKLADWLECYAKSLDLNVWTSSRICSASWDETNNIWNVAIAQMNGSTRSIKVKHLVFATGLGGGRPVMPDVPGRDMFNGTVVHSSSFVSARDYKGKKAIVVGAGNSGHDIAQDFATHGIDVTMYQRSSVYVISMKALAAIVSGMYSENGPPLEVADRLTASLPNSVAQLVHQRVTAGIAASIDKDIRARLESVGFKLNMGPDDAGAVQAFLRTGGGYYVDVGASELIANGDIRLKSGGEIQEFTRTGLKFTDGVELNADIVVFATGFGDQREIANEVCSPEVTKALSPLWGIDSEGELRSAWRSSGHMQLYFAAGNFAMSRLYSHYLALQIKAQELGIFGERWSI
ncbi:hypothetical protein ACEPAI_4260 [Sanghuangporus weigelae]